MLLSDIRTMSLAGGWLGRRRASTRSSTLSRRRWGHSKRIIHATVNGGSEWRPEWAADDVWVLKSDASRAVFAADDAKEDPQPFRRSGRQCGADGDEVVEVMHSIHVDAGLPGRPARAAALRGGTRA